MHISVVTIIYLTLTVVHHLHPYWLSYAYAHLTDFRGVTPQGAPEHFIHLFITFGFVWVAPHNQGRGKEEKVRVGLCHPPLVQSPRIQLKYFYAEKHVN